MARSFWTQIGKGARGVYAFMFHEGTGHDSYPKWALVRADLTPKDKMGALSDATHEVHRLEPLLMGSKPVHAVKPVALYYSRMDLSLGQPHLSLWADSADSPYHVYEALRGLGYAVRWITPRQVTAGELSQVGAVVMVDCQYVPSEAAARLEQWVKEGGVVIGDRWPGAFDQYARPQSTLAPVFGVASAAKPAGGSTLAMQQSSQGYGEVTIAALDPKTLAESVGEMWQQWDATHPVAREVGDFMLSGYGLERVECKAGHVIGMTFDGRPGIVLNEYGKGHALYFSMMLGSLYESAASSFEWDSTHSGLAFTRILDAYLKHAGVSPESIVRIGNPRLRGKLRIETPQVTEEGNAVICLTSLNDGPTGAFPLGVELPTEARAPRLVLAAIGGSRALQPVEAKMQVTRLEVTVPSFDTHATLLCLKDSAPLAGLEVAGAPRGQAGLVNVAPGAELSVKATVYNPSPRALAASEATVWLPRGWVRSDAALQLPPIAPYGSQSVTFKVRPPEVAGGLRLRAVSFRYPGASPATEIVWWGRL